MLRLNFLNMFIVYNYVSSTQVARTSLGRLSLGMSLYMRLFDVPKKR